MPCSFESYDFILAEVQGLCGAAKQESQQRKGSRTNARCLTTMRPTEAQVLLLTTRCRRRTCRVHTIAPRRKLRCVRLRPIGYTYLTRYGRVEVNKTTRTVYMFVYKLLVIAFAVPGMGIVARRGLMTRGRTALEPVA